MRISRDKARENREQVIAAASTLFRERGFDGIGVADVMKAAGFTHGGFYNHFDSKNALEADALARGFAEMADVRRRSKTLPDLLKGYLSSASRRLPSYSCPIPSLGGDVARHSPPVRAAFASGVEEMISSFVERLGEEDLAEPSQARERAVTLLATIAGAMMLARGVPDDHPLARELLKTPLAHALAQLAAPAADA
jgi:TetR/AcrR family transcriptional repressor of nem operon